MTKGFLLDTVVVSELHGLALVTRNVSDFTGSGVPVINPWEPEIK